MGELDMINIAFVILNYNLYDETINCVNSIHANIDTDNYIIIIVDNASPNGVGIKITNRYEDDDRVTVILNDENSGFAKGNNTGINLAKDLGAQFVCCLNNDTLLEQRDFYKILIAKYGQYKPAVIGPRIILKDGSECHRTARLQSLEQYKKILAYESAPKEISSGFKNNRFLRFVYDRCFSWIRKNRKKYFKESRDVVLHGCCLVFTPTFFAKLSGFNPQTFLYMEEEFLFIDVELKRMHTLYCPSLSIRHLEDVATDSVFRNEANKNKFVREKQVESIKKLIDYIESNKEELSNLGLIE